MITVTLFRCQWLCVNCSGWWGLSAPRAWTLLSGFKVAVTSRSLPPPAPPLLPRPPLLGGPARTTHPEKRLQRAAWGEGQLPHSADAGSSPGVCRNECPPALRTALCGHWCSACGLPMRGNLTGRFHDQVPAGPQLHPLSLCHPPQTVTQTTLSRGRATCVC